MFQHNAAAFGKKSIVKYFIEEEAPQGKGKRLLEAGDILDEKVALEVAARLGYLDLVKYFVQEAPGEHHVPASIALELVRDKCSAEICDYLVDQVRIAASNSGKVGNVSESIQNDPLCEKETSST